MLFTKRFFRLFILTVLPISLCIAQTNEILVTVNFENRPLAEVLSDLIKTEKLLIVYQDNHVNDKRITSQCDGCLAEEIIDQILYGTDLAWKRNGAQFIIVKPWLTPSDRTISGIVYDSQTGEPLPYVNVAVKGTYLGDVTNPDGYFAISGIHSTSAILQASYIGYQPQQIKVTNFKKTLDPLKIQMSTNILKGDSVKAFGRELEMLHSLSNTSRIAFAPRQISALPNIGEVDIMRSLQMYPGITLGRIGTAGLHIRGGTPDQNLIMFDGMTLYHIDHFFGFFSAFNPNAVKDVQVYKGGFPAKYGGRISGIVELSGKNGNLNHRKFTLSTGMLSTGFAMELPLWQSGSLFLSARRSHVDYFKTPIYNLISRYLTGEDYSGISNELAADNSLLALPIQNTPIFYFYDLNGKLTLMPSSRDVISISVYKGLDYFDQSTQDYSEIFVDDKLNYSNFELNDRYRWGNFGTSFRWSRHWQPNFYSRLFIANSIYNSETVSKSKVETFFDSNYTDIGNISENNFNEENTVEDASLRLENEYTMSATHKAEFGLGVSRFRTKFSTLFADNLWSVDEGNSVLLSYLYLQDRWSPDEKLQLTAGIRSNYYDRTGSFYNEPRLSFRYLLTENIALKGSVGQYHQFINRFINENTLDGANDFWLVAGDSIKPASSKHFVLGLNQTTGKYSFGIEGYYKAMDNLTEYNRQQALLAEYNDSIIFIQKPLFYVGSGFSQGLELSLHKRQGLITGWASYSYGKVQYNFPKVNDGKPYLADHDRTHEFKGVGMFSHKDWKFTASWVFSSGRVYTGVENIAYDNWEKAADTFGAADARDIYYYVLQGKKNIHRFPPIHWLEIAISKKINIGKINGEIDLSLFNVYNNRNVVYRRYEYWRSPISVTDVRMIGFTPSLGIKLEF